MENIKDYDVYTAGMRKSLRDKLFFEGLIDDSVNKIVDFGCADGQLLAQVHTDFPEWQLIGVDNNEKMLDLAQERCPDAEFYTNLAYVGNCEGSILNLSSVIHEVYSYSSEEEIANFWKQVFKKGWKYISIRDMIMKQDVSWRDVDYNDYISVTRKADEKQLKEFTRQWGSVLRQKNMLHYLLKYRYTQNWSREVKENYFPISLEQLLQKIPSTYEIVYFNHYILPFTKLKVRADFGIEIRDNTNVKILLRRRE